MTARWRPIGKHCDARRTMSDRTTTWALPAKVGLSDRRSTDACIRKISALSSPRDPKTSRNADTSQPDNQTFATFGAMLSSTYSRTPSKPHAVSVRLKLDDWTCLLQSRRDDAGESAPGLRFFATSPPSVQNPEIVHSFAQSPTPKHLAPQTQPTQNKSTYTKLASNRKNLPPIPASRPAKRPPIGPTSRSSFLPTPALCAKPAIRAQFCTKAAIAARASTLHNSNKRQPLIKNWLRTARTPRASADRNVLAY